jgi:hypothetical protein
MPSAKEGLTAMTGSKATAAAATNLVMYLRIEFFLPEGISIQLEPIDAIRGMNCFYGDD